MGPRPVEDTGREPDSPLYDFLGRQWDHDLALFRAGYDAALREGFERGAQWAMVDHARRMGTPFAVIGPSGKILEPDTDTAIDKILRDLFVPKTLESPAAHVEPDVDAPRCTHLSPGGGSNEPGTSSEDLEAIEDALRNHTLAMTHENDAVLLSLIARMRVAEASHRAKHRWDDCSILGHEPGDCCIPTTPGFIIACENPPPPNAKLRAAFERYEREVESKP